ncbi:hypothetical protein Tco_0256810, partial [Tanacetum coccineum]
KIIPPPTSEPSYFEGEPKFELVVGDKESKELEKEVKEEFEKEEEKDDLEYFDTFPTREDVSSVINHYLGQMVLGKSFAKQSKLTYDKEERTLTYDKEERTVMFEKNDERVTFKMPHKMKFFKDIEDLNIDNIPPFFVASKGDEEKGEGYVSRKRITHYLECLNLGPVYRHDEGIIRTLKFLYGRSSSMNDVRFM